MSVLHLRDLSEAVGDILEAFLFGHIGKFRVQHSPLFVLSGRGGLEILSGGSQLYRVIGIDMYRYRQFAGHSFEDVFEKHFRVFFLVIGGLGENRGYLLVAFLFRDGSVERIAIPRLRFSRKGLHKVFECFCAFKIH